MQGKPSSPASTGRGDPTLQAKIASELELSLDVSVAILAKTTIRRLARRSSQPSVRNATAKSSISSQEGLKNVVSTTFLEEKGSISINGGLTANASIPIPTTTRFTSVENVDAIASRAISGALAAKLHGKTTKRCSKQKVKDPLLANQ